MKNPFKFGTIVENEYFTDRVSELAAICQTMDSENHLILISPRRFGKSSLVHKAVKQIGRPYIFLNLQKVVSVTDFAAAILKEVFKLHPWERLKHQMQHFRVVPTISANPMTQGIDVSFQPMQDETVALEDALALLESVSTEKQKLIVIFDEFQEIMELSKGIDKRLRAILQEQQRINYIFLGSQESMMTEIFERKKSPFYHFGKLIILPKIPYDDFYTYLQERLLPVADGQTDAIATQILSTTQCHPYYTQQLASQVWDLLAYQKESRDVVETAIEQLVTTHDLDYERLWLTFNRTDKRVFQSLCRKESPLENRQLPTSTLYSSVKKLMREGYLIRSTSYDIEDPFFMRWIQLRQI